VTLLAISLAAIAGPAEAEVEVTGSVIDLRAAKPGSRVDLTKPWPRVVGATVRLLPSGARTTTGPDGRFVVRAETDKPQELVVKARGFGTRRMLCMTSGNVRIRLLSRNVSDDVHCLLLHRR